MLDRIFHQVFRHWLSIVNILVLLYAGLPWLSPLLKAWGYAGVGEALFRFYSPLCHQYAGGSFALLGHQVAFCHRETALFTALFVGGLLYGRFRHVLVRRPLPMGVALLLLLPLVIDGTTHTVDFLLSDLVLRSSNDAVGSLNWWLRMTTGVLFALGVVLAIYPRLDRDLRGSEAAAI